MFHIIDACILLALAAAALGGTRRGLAKSLCSLAGAVAGVVTAAALYGQLAPFAQNSVMRTVTLAIILLITTLLLYDLGTMVGDDLRQWLPRPKSLVLSLINMTGGGFVSAAGCLVLVWLLAAMLGGLVPQPVRAQLDNSLLLSRAEQAIPLPKPIRTAAQLLHPFGAPDAFIGPEPDVSQAPSVSQTFDHLDTAIARAAPAVVKLTVSGCSSTGAGSGFAVGKRLVVTNAHVLAGAKRITVTSGNASLTGQPVWFDPRLDLAIVALDRDISGQPLTLYTRRLSPGTVGAVLGYPGNGAFAAGDAIVLQTIRAYGYDIYQQHKTVRTLYAIRGNVVPGSSGGPLLGADGAVTGLVFGHATAQPKTGYAIPADQISEALQKAQQQHNRLLSTGPCVGGV